MRFVWTIAIAGILGSLVLAAQNLPEGTGKAVVSSKCTGCHGLEKVTDRPRDRDGWTSVVAKMIENGAHLEDEERQAAIDYLTTHFGPPKQAAPDPAAEQTAKRLIDGICASCHSPDLITSLRVAKAEWLEIVMKMNGKGAGLSEADVELLADYLARTYPPEPR